MRKYTFLLLGTVLLMLLPMNAWSQEAYTWLSSDGKTFTFCYDNQRSSRAGSTYSLSDTWNDDTKNVETVVFNSEFANVRPTSTSDWFHDMGRITEIPTLRYLNTSKVTDMSNMFFGCGKLTSLSLSNFNTASVMNMSGMFSYCSKLTSLSLSNFNTSKVTDMKYMFSGCSNLTSLDISNFNTVSVTDMEYMFSSCSKLSSLDLSSFKTKSVTNMGYMFSGCSKFTSLDLSNFNTESVTSMRCMFENCSGLTSLNLSNFNTESVTDMIMMFSNCKSLNSLNLSSFKTKSLNEMGAMFVGCSALTSLDLSSFTTESAKNMSRMFENCIKLTSLDISNFNTSNVTDMYSMFYNCNSLTSIDVRNFDTKSVENMQYMFYCCSSLTSLDLSHFDMSEATSSSSMLQYCELLQTLKISPSMSVLLDDACEGIGSPSEPCILFAPYDFNFGEGIDTSGDCFEWNEGYFKLNNTKITISSHGLATFCYDEDLDFSGVNGYKAYVVGGFNSKTECVTLVRVNDVPAGTGIIVKGTPGIYDIPFGRSGSYVSNLLIGTTEPTHITPTDNDKTNLVLSVKNGKIGFYSFTKAFDLEANKAYLQLPTSIFGANAMGLEFEDETTNIDGVETENLRDAVWYTIDGRKLDVRPAEKGLYISNGRKVVVK